MTSSIKAQIKALRIQLQELCDEYKATKSLSAKQGIRDTEYRLQRILMSL